MDKNALETRIAEVEERLKDLQNQRQSHEQDIQNHQQSMDFLDRQIIAVNAVLSDEKWLLQEMFDDKFPVVPESARQDVLDNRANTEDLSPTEVKQAREHVLKKEAMEFVEDVQTLKEAEQLRGDS